METILIVEDDPADIVLTRRAFQEKWASCKFDFVVDGDEALDYLHRRGKYSALAGAPLPSVLLLDLNMPKLGGLDVLREMRSVDGLKTIPVLVWSDSRSREDIDRAYECGAALCLPKNLAPEEVARQALALIKPSQA